MGLLNHLVPLRPSKTEWELWGGMVGFRWVVNCMIWTAQPTSKIRFLQLGLDFVGLGLGMDWDSEFGIMLVKIKVIWEENNHFIPSPKILHFPLKSFFS